jgi:glutamate-1-semialdehyde 2,1-aminomutase
VLCEPDSREPWFICEAHAKDDSLAKTLDAFEKAIDVTMEKLEYRGQGQHLAAG